MKEAQYSSAAPNEKVWGIWASMIRPSYKGENGSQENPELGDSSYSSKGQQSN